MQQPSCLFTSELKKKTLSRTLLSEDEIAGFLFKTEWKESKNTQGILLLDGCYPLFENYLQEKTCVCILKQCRKIGQSLEESLRGGKVVQKLEIV